MARYTRRDALRKLGWYAAAKKKPQQRPAEARVPGLAAANASWPGDGGSAPVHSADAAGCSRPAPHHGPSL